MYVLRTGSGLQDRSLRTCRSLRAPLLCDENLRTTAFQKTTVQSVREDSHPYVSSISLHSSRGVEGDHRKRIS